MVGNEVRKAVVQPVGLAPYSGADDVVVIVGSGFTGFECARRLSRQLRKHNASVDISIISPVDYMLYTPLLPDVAGGLVDARFVTIPLANTLRGVRTVRGRVDSVDFDQHTVTFTDPEHRSRSLSWDRLVLTPGSVTRLFDIPGLAEYARGLKSTAEAVYLRDHVLEQLELANIDDDKRPHSRPAARSSSSAPRTRAPNSSRSCARWRTPPQSRWASIPRT